MNQFDEQQAPIQKRAKKYISVYLTAILLFLALGTGIFLGQSFVLKKDVTNAQSVQTIFLDRLSNHSSINFDQFWTVWDIIKDRYVKKDKLEDKEMFYGAVQGLVASLGDPYSIYLPPKAAEEFNHDLSGELNGIGAEIGIRNSELVVIAPLPDTPAAKAGLLPGDKILSINGESSTGLDINTAVNKIRGPAKTFVALTISRNGQIRDLAIVRAKINVPSVTYVLKPGNIAYVRVLQFNESTMKDFSRYIEKIKQQKVKGVVLDLRNNPGGYLETAVDFASEWIPVGAIVSEKDVQGETNIHTTRGEHRLEGIKTIVLVNKGSASASEIVAGALQDHGKATIMGEKTFGKGSVQDYREFVDGSALKLTVAEWCTPGEKNINENGITPDVVFKQDYDKEKPGQDTMLQKALTMFTVKKK